ncbi:MAG: Ribosomal RNA large subunit methyltransferase E [Candidatus Bathyarchaeota archaeon BA1]|nr:MAG: Ribosomal RNA large subunit methyltransferase E [Candidatus Bathyarchaeota archaeon BA1]
MIESASSRFIVKGYPIKIKGKVVLSKAWVKERKREYYYRKAKEEKYRSRAVYKLLQAVEKHRFIQPGNVVVDLGAAPGGWTQASQKIVGDMGFVLGVDIKPIQPIELPNVHTITGDITDPQIIERIRELLPRPADVVISDVSPSISGIWELDHARQIDLARQSLHIATSILRPKGNLFVKTFQGDMLNNFINEVKQHFAFVRLIKPKASRARSAELYVLGMNLKRAG